MDEVKDIECECFTIRFCAGQQSAVQGSSVVAVSKTTNDGVNLPSCMQLPGYPFQYVTALRSGDLIASADTTWKYSGLRLQCEQCVEDSVPAELNNELFQVL